MKKIMVFAAALLTAAGVSAQNERYVKAYGDKNTKSSSQHF